MIAACRDRRHLRVDPVDPLVGVHVQFGDKAASDEAHSHIRHGALLACEVILLGAALRRLSEALNVGIRESRGKDVRRNRPRQDRSSCQVAHSHEPFSLGSCIGRSTPD